MPASTSCWPPTRLPVSTERALQELNRAARSLRSLADFLQANPEALLRGRGADPIPGSGPVKKSEHDAHAVLPRIATSALARDSMARINELLASDGSLPVSTERALQELNRAARSLRSLADFLQANPEALLRVAAPIPFRALVRSELKIMNMTPMPFFPHRHVRPGAGRRFGGLRLGARAYYTLSAPAGTASAPAGARRRHDRRVAGQRAHAGRPASSWCAMATAASRRCIPSAGPRRWPTRSGRAVGRAAARAGRAGRARGETRVQRGGVAVQTDVQRFDLSPGAANWTPLGASVPST